MGAVISVVSSETLSVYESRMNVQGGVIPRASGRMKELNYVVNLRLDEL
jgi:hypothetical protein